VNDIKCDLSLKVEIFNAKFGGLMLESTVGADQNGRLLNISEGSEVRVLMS
jgi:hypothetical protein